MNGRVDELSGRAHAEFGRISRNDLCHLLQTVFCGPIKRLGIVCSYEAGKEFGAVERPQEAHEPRVLTELSCERCRVVSLSSHVVITVHRAEENVRVFAIWVESSVPFI